MRKLNFTDKEFDEINAMIDAIQDDAWKITSEERSVIKPRDSIITACYKLKRMFFSLPDNQKGTAARSGGTAAAIRHTDHDGGDAA